MLKTNCQQDNYRKGRNKHAGKNIPAIEGTKPMGIDRHQPVPCSHRTADCKKHNKPPRRTPYFTQVISIRLCIITKRYFPQVECKKAPETKVHSKANQPKRKIQVSFLFLQDNV